jgi:hypothetical protein
LDFERPETTKPGWKPGFVVFAASGDRARHTLLNALTVNLMYTRVKRISLQITQNNDCFLQVYIVTMIFCCKSVTWYPMGYKEPFVFLQKAFKPSACGVETARHSTCGGETHFIKQRVISGNRGIQSVFLIVSIPIIREKRNDRIHRINCAVLQIIVLVKQLLKKPPEKDVDEE